MHVATVGFPCAAGASHPGGPLGLELRRPVHVIGNDDNGDRDRDTTMTMITELRFKDGSHNMIERALATKS